MTSVAPSLSGNLTGPLSKQVGCGKYAHSSNTETYSDGIRELVIVDKTMNKTKIMSDTVNQPVWVAVRVQRGFVTDMRAYRDEKSARRCERSWRHQMNPDYDETDVALVCVKPRRKSRSLA